MTPLIGLLLNQYSAILWADLRKVFSHLGEKKAPRRLQTAQFGCRETREMEKGIFVFSERIEPC